MPTKPRASLPARTPLATYRLQLNLNFTFDDAAEIVHYLDALGVSDLYTSPLLQARAGSLHGYDISDHGTLNPELGGVEAHRRLAAALRRHEMGCLVDIVPNHMGIGETANGWWMDVLENGPSSPFAPFFDIDWRPLKPELAGKVLLPVLADQFGRILEQGELHLEFQEGRFRITYHEHVFPVSPRSSSLVLRAILAGQRYIASYHTRDQFASTPSYFATPVSDPPRRSSILLRPRRCPPVWSRRAEWTSWPMPSSRTRPDPMCGARAGPFDR